MDRQFHIHVDAWELSVAFGEQLREVWKFVPSDFAGHPEGTEGFEPPHHFTYKTRSSVEFRRVFDAVFAAAQAPGAMRGYIEGEFLPIDEDVPEKPFDPSVDPPIRAIRLGNLPRDSFREAEIHIVMDTERSDPRLLQILVEMGLFSAYMKKPYGRAIIFTVGGTREHIGRLLGPLRKYLHEAGGAVAGSIKEERIAAYWLGDPNLRLPPVVASIDWSECVA